MRHGALFFLVLCASAFIFQLSLIISPEKFSVSSFLAGVFFTPSTTNEHLAATYTRAASDAARKVKILIIPGHDDASPGAQYKDLKEKDVNLATAKELQKIFGTDPLFEITLARDEAGYNETLIPQLLKQDDVRQFRAAYKALMDAHLASGAIQRTNGVFHNDALPETALRLYAINKWANENNFDLIINIHFNDYPGHKYNSPGKYNGFSIYVPEKQYSNALPSIEIGTHIKKELEKIFPVSNHPQEKVGVVEDQELIAIGANNTLNAAVVLIEYDYLYAHGLQKSSTRELLLEKYAQETYNGIKNYFETKAGRSGVLLKRASLAYTFTKDLERGAESTETLYLQLALAREGSYPPAPHTLNECPLSGKFGECTEKAVMQFQQKYSIPMTGTVGAKTREALSIINSAL